MWAFIAVLILVLILVFKTKSTPIAKQQEQDIIVEEQTSDGLLKHVYGNNIYETQGQLVELGSMWGSIYPYTKASDCYDKCENSYYCGGLDWYPGMCQLYNGPVTLGEINDGYAKRHISKQLINNTPLYIDPLKIDFPNWVYKQKEFLTGRPYNIVTKTGNSKEVVSELLNMAKNDSLCGAISLKAKTDNYLDINSLLEPNPIITITGYFHSTASTSEILLFPPHSVGTYHRML